MYDNTPDNTRAAIPTVYRGIRMRSRLEAKWAYFMDGLGWSWEYEPLDFPGWIPDFLVRTQGLPLLIDVKPTLERAPAIEAKIERALGESLGTAYQALVIGLSPFPNPIWESGFSIGWGSGGGSWETEKWEEMLLTCNEGIYGLASTPGDFTDRITNFYDGDHFGTASGSDVKNRWNLATNAVQWMPRAQR